jgi:ABC-2 type transport system permease protein
LSSERSWRFAETIRFGFLDHWAANPWRISATTTWPRAILQCLFFVLLGNVVASGQGIQFAYIGSVAMILTLPTSVGIAAVPMADKWMGTFYRVRLGRVPAFAVIAMRAVPWLLESLIMVVSCTVVVGAVTGQLGVAVTLLALTPVFVLMAVTSAAAGLAVASFAVSRNVDVLAGNALMYLIIAAGGIVMPVGRLPWLDWIGSALPLRNGLLAIRAIVADRPWISHLLWELVVGGVWAAIAAAGFAYHIMQSRKEGMDAFA